MENQAYKKTQEIHVFDYNQCEINYTQQTLQQHIDTKHVKQS